MDVLSHESLAEEKEGQTQFRGGLEAEEAGVVSLWFSVLLKRLV